MTTCTIGLERVRSWEAEYLWELASLGPGARELIDLRREYEVVSR